MRLISVFICISLIGHISIKAEDVISNDAAEVKIQSANKAYKGLPFYVAIEVKNTKHNTVSIPKWNPIETHLPIMMILKSQDGKIYTTEINRYGFIVGEIDSVEGSPQPIFKEKWDLPEGENVRSIVNMAPSIEKLNLPTGNYRANYKIFLEPNKELSSSAESMVIVSDKPIAELSILTNAQEISIRGAVDLKKALPSSDLDRISLQEIRETLAFASLLRELMDAKDITSIDTEKYKNRIYTWLRPEIEEIEYEILKTTDSNKSKQLKQAILSNTPSMSKWTEDADQGKGLINTIRKMK